MAPRILFYSGSFDPLTNGHLDMLRGAACLADKIVVGIGIHPGKTPLFTFEQRASLIREATSNDAALANTVIEIVAFDNLVIDAARKAGASVILRGLRDGTDLDYEMQMAGMNGTMAPEVPTIFLPASPATRFITATLVRQIAAMGGDVSAFVPSVIAKALTQRFKA